MRVSLLNKVEDAHEDALWCVAWQPDSRSLITGSVDETVKVWTLGEPGSTNVESAHTYTGHTLGVISVAIDATGKFAASSALDSFIRVWNLEDNTTKSVIDTPPSETWQIAFNPTADRLTIAAAGGSSNRVVVWSCDDAAVKEQLGLPAAEEKLKQEKFVLSVAYSPNGQRLACGAMDGTVAIFDVPSGKLLLTLRGHHHPVRDLSFTPDSKFILTACDDMHSNLYDIEHASLVEAFSGHESWVLSVACHPNGSAFATGSSDARVKLWDLQTRTCAQTVTEHTDQVWGVAWQAGGSYLASASDDKSVAVYDFS